MAVKKAAAKKAPAKKKAAAAPPNPLDEHLQITTAKDGSWKWVWKAPRRAPAQMSGFETRAKALAAGRKHVKKATELLSDDYQDAGE